MVIMMNCYNLILTAYYTLLFMVKETNGLIVFTLPITVAFATFKMLVSTTTTTSTF
jgi:hypothetical protein